MSRLGVPEDAVMVLTVARVDPMKDWGGVLEAVRDIAGGRVSAGHSPDEVAAMLEAFTQSAGGAA